jgi:murein L,D-transpeptidase YafK
MKLKVWSFTCLFFLLSSTIIAQTSFLDYQKRFPRVAKALKAKEDTLKKQFEQAKLQWPPKQLYIRSFKFDSQLEVWVRNSSKEKYQLFKTYKVCALSGNLGPKRMEGDYQVPEGFYYINNFNPNSEYHLSLGINYPNASDLLLSDSAKPGSDIYIHGSCTTVGCIPVMDKPMEEIYILSSYAKHFGNDFIPIHIFPIKFNNTKSAQKLKLVTEDDREYKLFTEKLKEVFEYFELHKQLPIISINDNGDYVIL